MHYTNLRFTYLQIMPGGKQISQAYVLALRYASVQGK